MSKLFIVVLLSCIFRMSTMSDASPSEDAAKTNKARQTGAYHLSYIQGTPNSPGGSELGQDFHFTIVPKHNLYNCLYVVMTQVVHTINYKMMFT